MQDEYHHSYWETGRFCLDKVVKPRKRCIEIKITLENKFLTGAGRKEADTLIHTPPCY